MAFIRPTLPEIVDRVRQDFLSRLDIVGAALRRSLTDVFAKVVAGAAHMLHGNLEYLSRQIFPDTSEFPYLKRQGVLFGVSLKAAEFATGEVEFTGLDGSIIEAGSILLRSDGFEYETDEEAEIDGGSVSVPVTARLAGEDGNCEGSAVLSLESPISGVDSTATVALAGITGGSDEEDQEDYRIRVLERMSDPPHGGNEADYIAWAKEVPGVTRAWVYPLELGAGTVVVRPMRDDDEDPIPDSGEIEDIQEYIDERRPVTADVTVIAPVAVPLDFEIEISPSTVDTRAAVEAELSDLLRRVAEPGSTILLSQIQVAIGTAEGVEDFILTSPSADVTHSTGEIAVMGEVTWA